MQTKDIKITEHNDVRDLGMHIVSVCDIRDRRAQALENAILGVKRRRDQVIAMGKATEEAMLTLWREYCWLLKQLHESYLVNQVTVKNLSTTVGRGVIAQRLAGVVTYTGIVNYGAIGSDSTAPVVGNTQLGTEVYRKGLSSGAVVANVAYLENFYSKTEVTGTFEEFAFFIDGSAGANTGQMWNRFLAHIVKTNIQSLNVQSVITLNSA